MVRVIFINETRTLSVDLWCDRAMAELIRNEIHSVEVARRPEAGVLWGPAIKLQFEGVHTVE